MTAESDSGNSYDVVPYTSYPYSRSHPRSIAVVAALFGMDPADIGTCRVLEIGCAAGGNLIPLAVAFPDAEFRGIDASPKQIEQGAQEIASLRLNNIRLDATDVCQFDDDAGKFDYILCHGVYSWVDHEVKDAILSVCKRHLAPQGVAFVSYNTYPGWYMRQGVREMMQFHSDGFDDTQEKIDQSRALIAFLSNAVGEGAGAYRQMLRDELAVVRSHSDSYLFHEHLETYNEPVYFHQFASRAESHELRYLGDAHFSTMTCQSLDEDVQQTLRKIAPDIIQMEQYLDFLQNRRFRQSLLCHRDTRLVREVDSQRIGDFSVAAPLTTVERSDKDPSRPKAFRHAGGRTLDVSSTHMHAAFASLAESWPGELSVSELAELAWQAQGNRAQLTVEQIREELTNSLLQCYSLGVVDLFSVGSEQQVAVSDRPVANRLARWQASQSIGWVTNLRHETVALKQIDQWVLPRLDGSVEVTELAQALWQAVESGDFSISGVESPSVKEAEQIVSNRLRHFGRSALLIG